MTTRFTTPGLEKEQAEKAIEILQDRLTALLDLQLTLKHVHWNVVGPHFIAVHEMLDPQVDGITNMVDNVAERIATLGGEPQGTPNAIVNRRDWKDYSLGRATVLEHLGALDKVFDGVNGDHRAAIGNIADIDPVSEDMLISQLADLELNQWFVRAHLESSSGELTTTGADTETEAAEKARRKAA